MTTSDDGFKDGPQPATETTAASPAPLGSRIAQRFSGLGLTEMVPELRGEVARMVIW